MPRRRVAPSLAAAFLLAAPSGAARAGHFFELVGSGFPANSVQGLDIPYADGLLSFEEAFVRQVGDVGGDPYLVQIGHPRVDAEGTILVLSAVDALVPQDCPSAPSCTGEIKSQVQLDFEDFVVTRTDGPPAGPVSARVNFELAASLTAEAFHPTTLAEARIDVSVRAPGINEGGSLFVVACVPVAGVVEQCSRVRGDGIFTPYDVPGTGQDESLSVVVSLSDGQSAPFQAPVGTPFRVGFALSAYATVLHTDPFSELPYGDVTVDAEPPVGLRLARDGPVLELPEGYTADSASAFVVDNRYVPEPSQAASALAAVASLLVCARRRCPAG